jgi:hypothetical protein
LTTRAISRLSERGIGPGSVLARSLPLVTVRDVLGHAELRTTNRYLHSKIDAAAIVAVNAAFGVVDAPTASSPA